MLSGSQTDVVIADHITGDSAHALKWSGRFEQFRVPAECAAGACVLRANLRKFGFTITARASNGIFRDTVDSLDAESVDEGRRCRGRRERDELAAMRCRSCEIENLDRWSLGHGRVVVTSVLG